MKKIVLMLFLLSIFTTFGSAATRPDFLDIKNVPVYDARGSRLSTTGTAADNRTALIAAITQQNVLIPAGTYLVSNDSGPIIIASDDVSIMGVGAESKIQFTSQANSGFLVTGADFSLSHLSLLGTSSINVATATYFGATDRLALVAVGKSSAAAVASPKIVSCYFKNPPITSIQFYKVYNGVIKDCEFSYDYTIPTITELTYPCHVNLNGSADCIVSDNKMHGIIQGILCGGLPADTFTAPSETVSSGNVRRITISGNIVDGALDHGVYASNECETFAISNNVISSVNAAIKGQGVYGTITGNNLSSEKEGILAFRNIASYNIIGNYGRITGSGYGIYIGESTSADGYQNLNINGNTLFSLGNKALSAIHLDGTPYLTSSCRIANVSISNNVLSNWATGDVSGAAYTGAIVVNQAYPAGVAASQALNLSIDNNIIQMDSDPTYSASAIILRGGATGATISNNEISFLRGYGVLLHGVSNAVVSGNSMTSVSGSSSEAAIELLPGAYGALDGVSNIATGVYNIYTGNVLDGIPGKVRIKSSTCKNRDKTQLVVNTSDSLLLYPHSDLDYLVINAGANVNVVATSSSGPFAYGEVLNILNESATATVTFVSATGTYPISPSSSARLIQTDSGTAGDNKANTWLDY